jgi:hypothetical protein
MARMEEALTFPCRFFFLMVAPFILEELYGLVPSGMILMIQYLDRVLRIDQICLEQCHFWQYYIHGCFQTLHQL